MSFDKNCVGAGHDVFRGSDEACLAEETVPCFASHLKRFCLRPTRLEISCIPHNERRIIWQFTKFSERARFDETLFGMNLRNPPHDECLLHSGVKRATDVVIARMNA